MEDSPWLLFFTFELPADSPFAKITKNLIRLHEVLATVSCVQSQVSDVSVALLKMFNRTLYLLNLSKLFPHADEIEIINVK